VAPRPEARLTRKRKPYLEPGRRTETPHARTVLAGSDLVKFSVVAVNDGDPPDGFHGLLVVEALGD
jgi:hypothetical protein